MFFNKALKKRLIDLEDQVRNLETSNRRLRAERNEYERLYNNATEPKVPNPVRINAAVQKQKTVEPRREESAPAVRSSTLEVAPAAYYSSPSYDSGSSYSSCDSSSSSDSGGSSCGGGGD